MIRDFSIWRTFRGEKCSNKLSAKFQKSVLTSRDVFPFLEEYNLPCEVTLCRALCACNGLIVSTAQNSLVICICVQRARVGRERRGGLVERFACVLKVERKTHERKESLP